MNTPPSIKSIVGDNISLRSSGIEVKQRDPPTIIKW